MDKLEAIEQYVAELQRLEAELRKIAQRRAPLSRRWAGVRANRIAALLERLRPIRYAG